MASAPIGIIGGTGIYALGAALENATCTEVETPFGKPSCALVRGTLRGTGREVVFISRHGPGHVLSPTEVPYAANVYALKSLGVRMVVSFSAVGSLKEEHRPTDIVVPQQFIDRTCARRSTFFGNGVVAHVSLARPVCDELAAVVVAAGRALDPPIAVKLGGTYVCMEGPAFSTRAESELYRSWNADLIGMTALTEAKLAREAELAYVAVALVTDYDCWRPHEEAVSAAAVSEVMHTNAANATRLIVEVVRRIDPAAVWPAHRALDGALATDPASTTPEARARLAPILSRLLK